jgi:transcriptional regulator with XRE-family HTH domain
MGSQVIAHRIRQAMDASGLSQQDVVRQTGVAAATIRRLRSGIGVPNRPTLDKLASALGIDEWELRLQRTPDPARVRRAHALNEALVRQHGPEEARALLVQRAESMNQGMSEEQRREIARLGGRAAMSRRSVDELRQMQARAVESRRLSGRPFKSDETRARHAAGASERGRKAGRTTLERHGREHFARIGAEAAARKKNGAWYACLFCEDPDQLLYRARWRLALSQGVYHRRCYEEWRKTPELVAYSRRLGHIGWIWSRVKVHGTEGLQRRVKQRVDDYLDNLRSPQRRGRKPTLLRDVDRAIAAALLHDEAGMTALEISVLEGLRGDADRYAERGRDAARATWELIQLGRTLLGTLPPGG